MKIFFPFLFFFFLPLASFSNEYTVGTGAQYKFFGEQAVAVDLSIYISESSFNKLGIEYFFLAGGFLGVASWQQYILSMSTSGMNLQEGYIQSTDMKHPEKMNKEFLENNQDGVRLEDFLFFQGPQMEKYRLALETVEVPAGKILATHYRKKRDEQVVDFWIAEKVAPIGLVKLISSGIKDKNQNYKIELSSLLKNVKIKINPANATPLSEKGRMFLGKKSH